VSWLELSSYWHEIQTPASGTGTSTNGQVLFNSSGSVAGDAGLTYDAGTGTLTSGIRDLGGQVYNVKAYGAKGDNSTDDTAAIQAAIDAVMGAAGDGTGGTLYFPVGIYRILGQLILRNDGSASDAKQPSVRFTGAGASANGRWQTPYRGASVLDLRVNAAVAKFDTRGAGVLEIDHLVLTDDGATPGTFIRTTNTTLKIHDCAFVGNGAGAAASVSDGIVLGGTSNTGYGSNATEAPFQGYGTVIRDNFFSKVRVCVRLQSAANAVTVASNTISHDCGSSTPSDAAIMFTPPVGEAARGNWISGNLIEQTYYDYAVYLNAQTRSNNLYGNSIWDYNGTSPAAYYIGGGGNSIVGYTDSFGANKFSSAPANTLLMDLDNGGVYSQLPVIRSAMLMPIAVTQFPANAGAAGINATTTTSHILMPLTGAVAFTVNAPVANAGTDGQIIFIHVVNKSGGALTVTWNAAYHMAAWGTIANDESRAITFMYDGSVWHELWRSSVDVVY